MKVLYPFSFVGVHKSYVLQDECVKDNEGLVWLHSEWRNVVQTLQYHY